MHTKTDYLFVDKGLNPLSSSGFEGISKHLIYAVPILPQPLSFCHEGECRKPMLRYSKWLGHRGIPNFPKALKISVNRPTKHIPGAKWIVSHRLRFLGLHLFDGAGLLHYTSRD
jgi:hypothetical protein